MRLRPFDVLTDAECAAVVEQALKIIETIGVAVTLPEATALLLEAGARRGKEGRLCLPAERIRELCGRAPARFTLHDRRGGSIEIGGGRSWTKCGGTVSQVLDWPGGALRKATRRDVARFMHLCDALPRVYCVVPMVEAQDVASDRAELVTFADTLANTGKFVTCCPVKHASARAWVEMGRMVTGQEDLAREPKLGLLVTVLPSLYLDDDCAATAILAAREGLPLVSMGGAIAGASAPNTIAATVSLKLAAELFVLALVQCVRPGAPVLLDCGSTILDMNAADIGEAGPEYDLGTAATAQAARTLNVPTYSCALHCEAKHGDFQAGMEKMAGMMAAALSGVDLTTNMGMVSRCSAASCEQLVLDDELCAFVERFCQGIAVNEDTLAMNIISEVGAGGDFLGHEHTVRHCRSGEMWYPALLDRSSVGVPAPDLYERAHARVEELLAQHRPAVGEALRRDLEFYVARAF